MFFESKLCLLAGQVWLGCVARWQVATLLLVGITIGGVQGQDVIEIERSPPNVVLIVSDDQGYRDLGCFGSEEVLTPHLDQLAAEGVKLTNFYVTWPACTPSRGSLLTGRYPQRNGIYDMIRNEAPDYGHKYSAEEYEVTFERIGGMDTREVLLPAMLQEAGYRSGIFGKWDLGSLQRYLPTARGFHHFYGFVNTGIDYFTHERYGVPSMYRDTRPTNEDQGVYCTDLFLREAKSFLAEHHQQPFLLYLPFNAPHGASNLDPGIRSAAQATEEFKASYPELASQAGLQDATRYGQPARVQNREGRRLEYVASITHMDTAIGEVLALLEEYNVSDNTLVIFFSDNGGGGSSDNGPLRGKKGDMFEGGIRVPAIVRYPGRIPADETRDGFCSSLDILPTILRVCEVARPAEIVLDGRDMLPMLASAEAPAVREQMFWKRRGDKAARVGTWKWVESQKGSGLFDLQNDLSEAVDLSDAQPEKLSELQSAFIAWQEQMSLADPRGPFRDY